MKYDFFAEKVISNCCECSMNIKSYPQMESNCLCYKDNDTETVISGFPEHCKLDDGDDVTVVGYNDSVVIYNDYESIELSREQVLSVLDDLREIKDWWNE